MEFQLECHNYIRVMIRQINGRCLICGTHAFSPKCREYIFLNDDRLLHHRREFDGQVHLRFFEIIFYNMVQL